MIKPSHEFRIRSATDKDSFPIVELAHRCFPTSFRFHPSVKYAYQWWSTAIHDRAAALLILEISDVPTGFSLLLLDEARWRRLRDGFKYAPVLGFSAFGLIPLAAKKVSLTSQRRKTLSSSKRPYCVTGQTFVGRRIFVELSGVAPEYRGYGLGTALGRAAENFAVEVGATYISRRVDKDNDTNISLLLKSGFTIYDEDKKQYSLAKYIT
jgi:ribosomal protein S18 acetylase RimI-like enzyme